MLQRAEAGGPGELQQLRLLMRYRLAYTVALLCGKTGQTVLGRGGSVVSGSNSLLA